MPATLRQPIIDAFNSSIWVWSGRAVRDPCPRSGNIRFAGEWLNTVSALETANRLFGAKHADEGLPIGEIGVVAAVAPLLVAPIPSTSEFGTSRPALRRSLITRFR